MTTEEQRAKRRERYLRRHEAEKSAARARYTALHDEICAWRRAKYRADGEIARKASRERVRLYRARRKAGMSACQDATQSVEILD